MLAAVDVRKVAFPDALEFDVVIQNEAFSEISQHVKPLLLVSREDDCLFRVEFVPMRKPGSHRLS